MKNILVPTDFSKPSISALETAVELAKRSGAKVTLLHVVEQVVADSYTISGEGHPDETEEKMFTSALIKKSRQQLTRLVMDPRYKNVTLEGELKLGNPFHGIRSIISEQRPDLVVMGTVGNGSLERMIIGTNTERVVRTMDCPVPRQETSEHRPTETSSGVPSGTTTPNNITLNVTGSNTTHTITQQ